MSTSSGAALPGLSINGTMPGWAERVDGNPVLAFVDSCLRGVGQVCFMNNPVRGLAILVAMFVGEAWLGFAGALGVVVSTLSTGGMLTGLALGANGVAIYNGLWGFNSFDAALAVGGVFFVLTWRSGLLAVACAVLAAFLFGAIASLFTPWGLPALTLPFCFATLAFVLLKGASKELEPVAVEDIRTPEEHLTRMRAAGPGGVGRAAMPI